MLFNRFRCILQLNLHSNHLPSTSKTCFVEQARHYAARKGTRAKMLALKREKKLAEVAKPKPPKPHLIRKVRSGGELERTRIVDDNWLTSKPVDNVWRTALYRGKPYAFPEIIEMHQEVHHPTMLGEPDAFVLAKIELDLRLKKKEHYLSELGGVVTYPHEFQTDRSNNVIAICKTSEDQVKAADAGALYVGSTSLVKQILSGEISSSLFDYVVCHPDMYKEIGPLRGILKKSFPSAHNGLLRVDVDRAVASFVHGVKYELRRSTVELDFGWTDVLFGRLGLPLQSLEGNLKHLLKVIEKNRPVGVKTPFVTRVLIWCENSNESFKLPHWEYLPGYETC